MASSGNNKTHVVAGLATTTVVAAPCTLVAVVVNTKGATGNTITIYDDVSAVAGSIVAIIDGTQQPAPYEYDCYMAKGLVIVSATGTGADYTVIWH